MTQKNLLTLVAAAIVLAGLYLIAVPGTEPTTRTAERRLFEGTNTQAVSSIKLEQGTQTVLLELKDGAWQLPNRGGYPADNSKIRALLLKIFDLSVSQRVPTDAKSQEKLAVSDEAVKQGFGHVVLSDASGNPIAGLRLGEARKSKEKNPMGVLGGQFVRKDGEQDVYLLGTPLTLNMAPASWLDVNLINLLPASVQSVVQAKNSDTGQEVEFELVRSGAEDNAGLPQFNLSGGVPEGKALQEPVVAQIRGGLENLRIADVQRATDEVKKELKFDRSTFYRASNGLVYRIDTAEKDSKFFAVLSVSFDPALVEQIKKEAEAKAAATPTPTPEATPEPGASPAPSPAAESKKSEEPKKPELTFATAEDAAKLTAQHQPWIYELPAHAARKLRYSKTELVEPPPSAPAQGQAPGMAPEMPPGMPGLPPGMDPHGH